MLKIVKSVSELPLQQLFEVYMESILRRAGGEECTHRAIELAQDSFVDDLRFGFLTAPKSSYCLWIVDGICVSALRLEPWQDGWLVASLETAPTQRKRGYAHALLTAVQGRLGAVKLYSHIHRSNCVSIRVHEACGFVKIADTAKLLDGTVTSQMGTYLFQN